MIRILLIFIVIFSAILFTIKNKRLSYEQRRRMFIHFIIFLFILHSGLRNIAVGSDTYQYYNIFQNVQAQSFSELLEAFLSYTGIDPFYDLFQKVIQFFSESYQVYLFIVACIFMVSLGNFILKNTSEIRHAVIAFLLYLGNFYGFYSITGIRQTIATAILLYAYEFIKSNSLFRFLLCVITAGLFHSTALIFLPLYFAAKIRRPLWLIVLSVVGFPLFLYFKNQLVVFMVIFLNVEARFGVYADQYQSGGSYSLTLLYICLSVWSIIVYKKMMIKAPSTYIMYNTFALALFFLPLQWLNPSLGRISMYFSIVMLVWVPYLMDNSSYNLKTRNYLYFILGTILFILTLFSIRVGEYKFFWQEMSLPIGY